MEYGGSDAKTEFNPARDKDDDFGELDSAILDPQTSQVSPNTNLQRESSLAETVATFPSDAAWNNFAINSPPTGLESESTGQIVLQPRAQPMSSLVASHARLYSHPRESWQVNGSPGVYESISAGDQLVDFDGNPAASLARAQLHTSPTTAFNNHQLNTGSAYQNASGFPASPHSGKEGWISGSSSDGLDFRNMPQHAGTHSPNFIASTNLLRRDGIRKKNARFEIPAERNLRTIDQLINQTNDEHELKELKQQKRLLRNRQAALDSRQRKKQHTERLEEEKKHYTAVISELEDALGDLRLREAEWTRTKDNWMASQHQMEQYIDSLLLEKEEIVRRHTLETGELRKKNSILIEQLQRMEGHALSTAPSAPPFMGEYPEYDPMTMNSWDDFPVTDEFSIETDHHVGDHVPVPSKNELQEPRLQEDKTVASGFLLMLLLCGAWVASQSSSTSAVIPSIPDDMRAASATVLDNLYKGSGIKLEELTAAGPFPSPVSRRSSSTLGRTTLGTYEIASLPDPSLDSLHQRLTAPSRQQLREQAFTLTPSQYNELVPSSSYPPSTFHAESHETKNIGEILGTAHHSYEGSTVDTYAKSLLRGKVSTQVLKDFARMVAESRTEPRMPWKSEEPAHLGLT